MQNFKLEDGIIGIDYRIFVDIVSVHFFNDNFVIIDPPEAELKYTTIN
jgi:hypothetical protein